MVRSGFGREFCSPGKKRLGLGFRLLQKTSLTLIFVLSFELLRSSLCFGLFKNMPVPSCPCCLIYPSDPTIIRTRLIKTNFISVLS
jgi:hypothetical protein